MNPKDRKLPWPCRLGWHWWHEINPAVRPDRSDWWCVLRHCRCRRVQYKSFGICGTGRWHDLADPSGCWASEHLDILKSARHHGLV